MRRLLGLLIVLYSLLLGLNTTLPLLVGIVGDKVTAVTAADTPECSAGVGAPPYAGLPDSCAVTWSGSAFDNGTLYGVTAEDLVGAASNPVKAELTAYEIPFFGGYGFVPLAGIAEKVAAIIAIVLFFIGFGMLFRRRKRGRRGGGGGGHHGDHDHDDYDSDSGDSGDSGGGGDGGGGGGD